LLLIDVDSQIVGIHRKWETTLKVKILDLTTDHVLWASEQLTAEQIATAEESGGADPRAISLRRCWRGLRPIGHLVTMPQLSAENVKKRLASLAHHDFDNPLPVLAELRYYQSKKLAEPTDLGPLYERFLGPESADKCLEATSLNAVRRSTPLSARNENSAAALRCFLLRIKRRA